MIDASGDRLESEADLATAEIGLGKASRDPRFALLLAAVKGRGGDAARQERAAKRAGDGAAVAHGRHPRVCDAHSDHADCFRPISAAIRESPAAPLTAAESSPGWHDHFRQRRHSLREVLSYGARRGCELRRWRRLRDQRLAPCARRCCGGAGSASRNHVASPPRCYRHKDGSKR